MSGFAALERRELLTRLSGLALAVIVVAAWLTNFHQVAVSVVVIALGLLMFLGIGFPTPRGIKSLGSR